MQTINVDVIFKRRKAGTLAAILKRPGVPLLEIGRIGFSRIDDAAHRKHFWGLIRANLARIPDLTNAERRAIEERINRRVPFIMPGFRESAPLRIGDGKERIAIKRIIEMNTTGPKRADNATPEAREKPKKP